MYIGVQAGSPIGECCASGNDIDVTRLFQSHRQWRFDLCQVARHFAALWAAAEAQPRGIDADTTYAGRFANSISIDVIWLGCDVTLDLRVECAADGENSASGTTQGNRLIQGQDFLKEFSRPPIGQMGGPLGLQVLQLRSDSLRKG